MKEFYSYEDQLTEIAVLALDLYRAPNPDSNIRIYVTKSSTGGVDNDLKNFEVDSELSTLLVEMFNSDMPCYIGYIIIGDSYVTFTREGPAYALMYSEDDVRPIGVWKYNNDELDVNKFTDCWYELKAYGLGVHADVKVSY